MTKKLIFSTKIIFIYLICINCSFADIQKKIINKLTTIKTLSFNFTQTIADKKEIGNCYIKYPLLMKCNYNNLKQKTIISDGKKIAIIKKKYKKIYLYPIKTTPLFFALKKQEIINLVRKNKPYQINQDLIAFKDLKKNKNIIIFFDKQSFEFKGWETKDIFSNNVTFMINELKINNQILDNFFKIPQEKDL